MTDGQPFLSFDELKALQEQERTLRLAAEQRADTAEQRADTAEQRADTLDKEAEQARRDVERMAELSLKVVQGQASPDEIQELQRLARRGSPPSP